jgi:hypothetical protein
MKRLRGGSNAALALGAAWLVVACAASAPKVPESGAAQLGANQGVIVGRIAVEKDGNAVTTDMYKNLLKPEVAVHLSPFEGIEKLARNEWKPGKWFIRTRTAQGGYFSTTLPAGKYYIVEFIFIDITREMLALRTYDSNSSAKIMRPLVVAFEVLPGKTTYVGTLVHKIDTFGIEWASNVGWSMNIVDESTDVTQWFRAQHPRTEAVGTQLALMTAVQ